MREYHQISTKTYFYVYCIGTLFLLTTRGFKKGIKYSIGLLVGEYVFLILCSTVLLRKYAEVFGYNYTPFWSYVAIQNGRSDLIPVNIMNVVVFIPVGFLLGCMSQRFRWWMILLIGFCMSLSIESMQFYLKRGFAEFDDVFHNTLGCLIGFMLVGILKGMWKFCSFLFVPQWGKHPKDAGILEPSN